MKNKLDLSSGSLGKYYASFIKLKADLLFKLEDYAHACTIYTKVLQIYDELNNHTHTRALVLFCLGVSYLYAKEFNLSKENLKLSYNKYEVLNKINQNQFKDKVDSIATLLASLNSNLFA
jgi:hypothetical protein